VNWCDMCDER